MKSITTLLCLTLAALLPATTTQAAEIEAETTIDSVLVSPDSAIVTRTGTVSIPAGSHSLVIRNLPGQVDPSRLVLRMADSTVRIGNLRLRREFQSDFVGQQQQQLEEELQALRFARREVSDRIDSARIQLQFLDSLASGSLGTEQGLVSTDNLSSLLSSLAEAGNGARQTIREAEREVADLDVQIGQIEQQLREFQSRERSTRVATAALSVDVPTDTAFTVSYPVREARWQWQHEARLDSENAFLELTRNANVVQTSGEDWNDVALTITTAQSNRNIVTPEADPLLVGLLSQRPPVREARSLALSARSSSADAVEEVVVSGNYMQTSANVSSTTYRINYRVPGTVTVASGGEQQIFPVDERGVEVDLALRTVPEAHAAAYLEARFTMDDEIPIQGGQMQFYLDGSFIGSAYSPALLPGEEVSLPFGQDERIRVDRLAEEEDTDAGGTFRRASENVRQRYVITSFHDEPVDIEIIGMLPVPQNEDIEVEIDNDATEADIRDIDDKRGTLMWQRRLPPAEAVEIRHFYSIRYPEGEQLDYRRN